MTIQNALSLIHELKPHSYSDELLVRFLSDCDMQIYLEILAGRQGFIDAQYRAYDSLIDMDTELLVLEPYSKLYSYYLSAQIDFWNGDINSFNNSMLMYNATLKEYSDFINRQSAAAQRRMEVF